MGNSIWIMGDQLSLENSALQLANRSEDQLVLIESRAHGSRLPYHKHRQILIYSAMRHFAAEREGEGWTVDYHSLERTPDFVTALRRHLEEHRPDRILMAEPNNHFEMVAVEKLKKQLPLEIVPTRQFLISRKEFREWAAGKKRVLMESHYRRMRQRFELLLTEKGDPEGGKWNFDHDNRAGISDWRKADQPLPDDLPREKPDQITLGVMEEVERIFPDSPGRAEEFWLPVTRERALFWLDEFLHKRLQHFGDYQDTMVQQHRTMFHSMISPMINLGLLSPLECAREAEAAYRSRRAPLAAVEGFVRQVIGWREFVNGVYWLKMPDYAAMNALEADRALPRFFYTGETDLNCLRQTIGQALDTGYNHHIQRLMILGNFLLLAGVNPQQALRWFSEMYVDAHDWVMAANVLGMALHADGGFMATKPYAAGPAYISRMSNYCADCRYRPTIKTGPNACPFHSLYWNFYDRHQTRLAANPRTGMMVRSWLKRPPGEREQVIRNAEEFLESLDT